MSASSRARRVDAAVKKHRPSGGSPESPEMKASPQGPPNVQFPKRVPVVYYLYRNRHLEHPHFIEVPLSSSHGLLLKDFVKRLNVLRGKGMPALYSWSCKRSYKNGFVWHDLCEDDMIYPTNGNEYILKGSELLDEIPSLPPSDCQQQNALSMLVQTKQHRESPSASTSSSSPAAGKLSRSSDSSPSTAAPEYRLFKASTARTTAADVATQTSDGSVRRTCSRGVTTEEPEDEDEERDEPADAVTTNHASPPPCSTSSGEKEKPETLESLITADRKLRGYRLIPTVTDLSRLEEGPKPRMTDVLMQLISCGSISVKDSGLSIAPTGRSGLFSGESRRFADSGRFPWKPGFMCELDSLCENPRLLGLRLEDKEYFSGSFLETKKRQEEGANALPSLKRCSSYNAERNGKEGGMKEKQLGGQQDEEHVRSKCIPRTIKAAQSKLPKSPLADNPRKSSSRNFDLPTTVDGSSSERKSSSSKRFETEDKGKIVKIEERLPSGARVIIQAKAGSEESEGSNSS